VLHCTHAQLAATRNLNVTTVNFTVCSLYRHVLPKVEPVKTGEECTLRVRHAHVPLQIFARANCALLTRSINFQWLSYSIINVCSITLYLKKLDHRLVRKQLHAKKSNSSEDTWSGSRSLCDDDRSPDRAGSGRCVALIFPSRGHPRPPPIRPAPCDQDTRRRGTAFSCGGILRSCSPDSRAVISRQDCIVLTRSSRSQYKQ